MTLRKGQKLINYLRYKIKNLDCTLEEQDALIRRHIFNMYDSEFDRIVNMSDKDCWEKIYKGDNVALSDKIMKQKFGNNAQMITDINRKVIEEQDRRDES